MTTEQIITVVSAFAGPMVMMLISFGRMREQTRYFDLRMSNFEKSIANFGRRLEDLKDEIIAIKSVEEYKRRMTQNKEV